MKDRVERLLNTREAKEMAMVIIVVLGELVAADKTLANIMLLIYKVLFMLGIIMFGKRHTASMIVMFFGSLLYKIAGNYGSMVDSVLSEGTGTLVIYTAGMCWCICKAVKEWTKEKANGVKFRSIVVKETEFRKAGMLLKIQFWGLLLMTTFGLVYMQGKTTGSITAGGVMTSAWVAIPVFAAIAMVIRLWESYALRALVCVMSLILIAAEAINGILEPTMFIENVVCLAIIVAEAIIHKPRLDADKK